MISVEEITKITEKKNKLKKETYVKIFEQISKKIRQTVEIGNKHLFIQIPSFVIGYPAFDRLRATMYIKRQLDLSGFETKFVGDHELFVTWSVKKNKNKHEPPPDEFGDFPSFVNLRKVANKYRANAGKGS